MAAQNTYSYENALERFKSMYFYNLKDTPEEDNETTYKKYSENLGIVRELYSANNNAELFQKLKTTVDNYKTRDKTGTSIVYMDIHGTVQNSFFEVPENVVVVLLTPINRISSTCINPSPSNIVVSFLQKNFEIFTNHLICIDKGSDEKLLRESIVLLPGQICNNLKLMRYFKESSKTSLFI